jgi:hypothetical protein
LIWAECDFSAAQGATKYLIDNYESLHAGNVYRPIETGIVITYSRPFGNNQGLGSLAGLFRTFDDSEFADAHDFLLLTRDIQEAHHDLSKRASISHSSFGPDGIDGVQIEIGENGQVGVWDVLRPKFIKTDLERIEKLIGFQRNRAERQIVARFKALALERDWPPGRYILGRTFP